MVDRRRSSSPCWNLDELSSSDDDTGGSVCLSDILVTLLCGSDDDHTPVNSYQVLSDVDLPPESVSNDKRQVIRIRDVSPDVQIVDVSPVGQAWDSRRTVSRGGSGKRMPLPLCIPATPTSGRYLEVTPESSGPDPALVVGTVAIPAVESVEAVKLSSPPLSGQLSPASPPTVAWEYMGDSSVPLSPNRVHAGHSQDVPDEGSLFHMSPVSPGFLIRSLGTTEQHPQAGVLLPTTLDDLSDSVLGDPITYAQCEQIPGSDTPMTLPVYTLPSRLAYMLGQSSVQTVLASGISSRPEVWYSALASPMDTEDARCLRRACRADRIGSLRRCAGVGWIVVLFADVLGGSAWRGTGDGSCSQPATGCGDYVVQSSDTVAVRDVATSNVVGIDVHRHGTGGVSYS